MHRNVARRRDSDAHLIALDAENGHGNAFANLDALASPAGKYEHCGVLLGAATDKRRERSFQGAFDPTFRRATKR